MAIFGNAKQFMQAAGLLSSSTSGAHMKRLMVVGEESRQEFLDEISSEEFLIDNRTGKAPLKVSKEFIRTLTSNLSIESSNQLAAKLGANLVAVATAQIESMLSEKLAQALGETISSKETFQFEASAGEFKRFVVTWRARTRTGICLVNVDGSTQPVEYTARLSLTCDVRADSSTGLRDEVDGIGQDAQFARRPPTLGPAKTNNSKTTS